MVDAHPKREFRFVEPRGLKTHVGVARSLIAAIGRGKWPITVERA
jgi:hypothetical protein